MSIQNLFSPNDYNLFANSIRLQGGPYPSQSAMFTYAFTGPWAGTQNLNIYCSTIGGVTTISFGAIPAVAAIQSAALQTASVLPAAYCPSLAVIQSGPFVINNSLSAFGTVTIGTSGTIVIYFCSLASAAPGSQVVVLPQTNFTGAGTAGLQPFSVAYSLLQ